MANDLDNLIDSLQRQRADMETEINATRERDAADLVNKLEQLRKRSEETDETWRRHQRTQSSDLSR